MVSKWPMAWPRTTTGPMSGPVPDPGRGAGAVPRAGRPVPVVQAVDEVPRAVRLLRLDGPAPRSAARQSHAGRNPQIPLMDEGVPARLALRLMAAGHRPAEADSEP
jgi:hypothetical protein